MAKQTYKLSENSLAGIIKTTINEFLDRDTMDRMSSLGIKDSTEDSVLNEAELKQKCSEFIQKCNLFYETLREFYGYIYGVEEDKENGVQAVRGAREIMRNRNMFGARDIHDEYLEEDLGYLSDSLSKLQSALEDSVENAETFV